MKQLLATGSGFSGKITRIFMCISVAKHELRLRCAHVALHLCCCCLNSISTDLCSVLVDDDIQSILSASHCTTLRWGFLFCFVLNSSKTLLTECFTFTKQLLYKSFFFFVAYWYCGRKCWHNSTHITFTNHAWIDAAHSFNVRKINGFYMFKVG